MDLYTLPASTYQPPPRLVRKHHLNTIIEDKRGEREEERRDDGTEDLGRLGVAEYTTPRSVGTTSPVPSLTSSVSSYYWNRASRDGDSLFEESDDDSELAPSIMTDRTSIHSDSADTSPDQLNKGKRCPSLIIPSPSFWPAVPKPPQESPPRPPKIPLSPAALSMLGHDLPRLSNPPSLTGSHSTDTRNVTSAPITPEINTHPKSGEVWGQVESRKAQRPKISICTGQSRPDWSQPSSAITPDDHVAIRDFATSSAADSPVLGSRAESESGVELPFDALATLQHLSLEAPPTPDSQLEEDYAFLEMQESSVPSRTNGMTFAPASAVSQHSLSGMSVPSPTEFFSSLGNNAQRTWHMDSAPVSALPPTSTTAEQFYACPWNKDTSPPVEQVIHYNDSSSTTDGPPTARQIALASATSYQTAFYVPNEGHEKVASPIIEQDEDYHKVIEESAEKSLDRTTMWLAQQTSYMAALRETNPVNDISAEADRSKLKRNSSHIRKDSLGSPIRKAVRFLETETAMKSHEKLREESTCDDEPIYGEAFSYITSDAKRADAFRHRLARSDSVNTVRQCLPHEHIKRLQGEYHISKSDRPSSHRPISMMPGKESAAAHDETLSTQKLLATADRERQALEQVSARSWIIEASKYLSGGSLLNSPARTKTIRTPKLGGIRNGRVLEPARVLDLGGLPHGDWGWHCAREFPHSRVFTATTETHLITPTIRGPRNHRITGVESLYQLPFPSNHFHAISLRAPQSALKLSHPHPHSQDEYDLTLAEALRCLRPGGYLEFHTMDAELVSAGPFGSNLSVSFAFQLKSRGYDPTPTKFLLSRIRKAGFDDIKRAWTFLPMATGARGEDVAVPETPPPGIEEVGMRMEAVQGPIGSTADAASLSGLVGGWGWEQWMVKTGCEGLLGEVPAVMEEGKSTGAGWRCLSGWARKPLEMMGV